MAIATRVADPTTDYARSAVDGHEVVGRLVRLACQRHLDDLEHGHERGLYFDVKAANLAIKFFGLLRLAEGEHAGKPFVLRPFQEFKTGCLFGWKRTDGSRRFRTAYVEEGKGNGKTPWAAGIGLKGLCADNEAAAEIYTAGVTRSQANYLLRDADRMVTASPALRKMVKQSLSDQRPHLSVKATNSRMEAVSSQACTLDQKRVHIALIDEIHEHRTGEVVDKLSKGMKGRRNPLIIEITNSGYDRTSICWQHHEYSIKVLEGAVQNDEWFAFVCALDPCPSCYADGKTQPVDGCDECDDWQDETVWPKVNPNLDVSISRRYLRGEVEKARGMPAEENITKRLNFCIWTEQITRLIPMESWDSQQARTPLAELARKTCIGGLDLSEVSDFTAFVLLFANPGGGYDVVPYFWLPEEAVRLYTQRGVPCEMWVKQGYIEEIPGGRIDQRVITQRIKELCQKHRLLEIPYDPWNAVFFEAEMGDVGAPLVAITQNFQHLSAPTKEMLALLKEGKWRHGNNPVLRYMATCVAALEDSNGNLRPHKGKSSGKIDGISAGLNALNRAMLSDGGGQSVYETRGPIVLG